MWRSGSVSVLGTEGHMFKSYHSEYFIMLIILNIILILSALCVFLTQNPVYSVLFLVLTFLSSASICFIFGADFLGILFVIIYVGAIAVLFLFIVMMLDIKIERSNFQFFFLFCGVLVFIFSQVYVYIVNVFSDKDFYNFPLEIFDTLSIEFYIGQLLYNYYVLGFLISGIILLIAMIGAIVLTLNFTNKNLSKQIFRQLVRTDKFLSFF